MDCPKCVVEELHSETVHLNDLYRDRAIAGEGFEKEIEVFQCYGCRGFWFEPGALEELLSEKVTILRTLNPLSAKEVKALDAKPGKCPKCGTELVKKKAPTDEAVTCDYCEKCRGTWLDCGEIDELEMKSVTLRDRLALFLHGLGFRKQPGS